MNTAKWFGSLVFFGCLACAASLAAQSTPYIGYIYPAGARQGTTARVRLGGQRINGVTGAVISGRGVKARLVEYRRKLGPQEINLLRGQLRELKRGPEKNRPESKAMVARISRRMAEYVNRPACAALSSIAELDITVAPHAPPGMRELRLVTPRGTTNPMAFVVGQLPETARKPMKTAVVQVLGKEALAQRKRPPEEAEVAVSIPCTMNGQIASGEINTYRFNARRGQRLVFVVQARELIPYVADAVPGWFQPVLTLYDGQGNEVAYDDDYQFRPDPVIYYEVPKTGEYVLAITDAIYRGREDFVYRISVGELPFVTSCFPLGGPVGESVDVQLEGWNLSATRMTLSAPAHKVGTFPFTTHTGPLVSNPIPFERSDLPERMEREQNDRIVDAEQVALPIVINGRMNQPADRDVFRFQGRAGEKIVLEVLARRLDSPVDSFLKITDKAGKVLAFNDDHEDPGSGLNTHHADSYLSFTLPASGPFFAHLEDTARQGGPAYGYRLRISRPRPDFELRVVPSSVPMRIRGSGPITVHILRKDGFDGPVTVTLRDPPEGILMKPIRIPADKDQIRTRIVTRLTNNTGPFDLFVQGTAKIGGKAVAHDAVPAEDRMQAFLWRHLVPAKNLAACVYDPKYRPPPKRVHRPTKTPVDPPSQEQLAKVKFTKRQVANRLRQIEALFQEGLLTDEFNDKKVAECEAIR